MLTQENKILNNDPKDWASNSAQVYEVIVFFLSASLHASDASDGIPLPHLQSLHRHF